MKRLSGQEVKRVQQALLSGFSYDAVRELVLFELDTALENVVPPGSMQSVTLALVAWTEQTGLTERLIKAAMAARPHNSDVASLCELLSAAPAAADPNLTAADQQRRLRGLLLDQFPRKTDVEILLSDSLGRTLDEVAGGGNHTDVCFNLVKWLWIDRENLRRFLETAVRERRNSFEIKALQQELFPR
jgi:hypothetical protein